MLQFGFIDWKEQSSWLKALENKYIYVKIKQKVLKPTPYLIKSC